MATAAVSSYQTQAQLDDGAGNYTTIAEVRSIGPVGSSYNLLDASNQDSPNAFKEWIAGMLDGDEFDLETNAVPSAATQGDSAGLRYVHKNRLRRNLKVILPTSPAATITFSQLVRAHQVNVGPTDQIITARTRHKIVSLPAYT